MKAACNMTGLENAIYLQPAFALQLNCIMWFCAHACADDTQGRYEFLTPKETNLRHRLHGADDGFIDFVQHLLAIDPAHRPSAESALQHPWLQVAYEQDS